MSNIETTTNPTTSDRTNLINEAMRMVGGNRRTNVELFRSSLSVEGQTRLRSLLKFNGLKSIKLGELRRLVDEMSALEQAQITKVITIDEIKALIFKDEKDFTEFFSRRLEDAGHPVESFSSCALGQRSVGDLKQILLNMIDIEHEREQIRRQKLEERAAARRDRQSRRAAEPKPPTIIPPTWMEDQKHHRTGKPNPQGVRGVTPQRGVTVAGAGKGTKENSRKLGK